ncbi:RNA polymerase sigma factor [Microbulbifer yueqingensis]|uniref:RNA polymerase sigma-70 factor, ECF subfamily n=1 Tax=Microbulbifer yueqingensis TaxID=658219 RepID=A0A1G9CX05_9GAMM|nr:sigma-70 family RNA polymerase sigma factor [Microbulbifer yueqingensis]SDK56226.1 RNA polymerase sigma-70 factor, ECF subfamily [Microbulbifer yueqingensis]
MNTWLTRAFNRRRSHDDRFVSLVCPHLRSMYRMAYRWSRNRHEAEDLVQDVLVRLLPRVAELEKVERLGPWLVKVLFRRYVDLYRRRRASPVDLDCELQLNEARGPRLADAGSEDYRRVEMQRALERALAQLPDEWRDIVLLHDVEGYTAIEVAEILSIPVGTAKSRLSRAHQRLKKSLGKGTLRVSEAC